MAKYKCPVCGKPCEKEEGCFLHKPRKALKSKPKSAVELQKQHMEIDKMWSLFLEIWKERGPFSEVSGKYLGPEPLTYMFDHLLPKESYPLIKYEKWNIILCTLDEHTLKGNGYPLPKHKQAIDEAYSIYNSL